MLVRHSWLVRHAPVMVSITPAGPEVTIRIRGHFDDRAVDLLCEVISDLMARGGTIADVVLDLGATTRCSTSALESVGALVGAGMRINDVRDDRHCRPRISRRRGSGQRRASQS
jgi:hypothetical protein